MFSDHLPKIDRVSGRSLLLMAGGLVIVCQLVAMVLVAGEQVRKAELRDTQQSQQRAAIARCYEGATRAARQECMLQARNGLLAGNQMAASVNTPDTSPAPRELASYTDFTRGPSASMQVGVMGVSFAAR